MTVVAGPEPGDTRQPIRSRLRCRVLTRPEAVSVAMHDPPPAASTLAFLPRAACPVYVLDFAGLLAGLPHMPMSALRSRIAMRWPACHSFLLSHANKPRVDRDDIRLKQG